MNNHSRRDDWSTLAGRLENNFHIEPGGIRCFRTVLEDEVPQAAAMSPSPAADRIAIALNPVVRRNWNVPTNPPGS